MAPDLVVRQSRGRFREVGVEGAACVRVRVRRVVRSQGPTPGGDGDRPAEGTGTQLVGAAPAGPRLLAHVLGCAARHVGFGALRVSRVSGWGVPVYRERGRRGA